MTNEHDQSLPNQDLHERLCAFVLGEGTPEERTEIERELLRSPELRAQRERIERTVGLVQSALGDGESLSPAAAESLRSAASSSRPSAWKGSTMLRLAAGIGAVALGYAIVRESTVMRDTDVARVNEHERFSDERGRGASKGSRDQLPSVESLGVKEPSFDRDESSRLAFEPQAHTATSAGLPQPNPVDVPSSTPHPAAQPPAGTVLRAEPMLDAAKAKKTEELVLRQRDLDKGLAEGNITAGGEKRDQTAGVLLVEQTKPAAPAQTEAKDVAILTGWAKQDAGTYRGPGDAVTPTGASLGQSNYPNNPNVRQEAPSLPGISGPATGGAGGGPGLAPGAKPGGDTSSFKMSRAGGTPAPSAPSTSPAPPPPPRELRGQLVVDGFTDSLVAAEELKKSGDDEQRRAYLFARLDDAEAKNSLVAPHSDWGESEPYYKLTPAEQQMYLERRCRLILDQCVRRPSEKPRDMFFRFWGDNPFEVTALDAQSTFGADVDTASYALARRYLNEGNVPEKAQIRTEEFVNYFKSDVNAPTSGVFAIHTDLAPSRYSTDSTRQMLRVVVKGKELSKVERPRMNLTFVVDVSGSMREQMRLEMVKTAIRLLVLQLNPYDKIGIVKFSTDASVVLPLTNVSEREKIELAIEPLKPDGSTNSNAGLELGYGMAVGGFDQEATNRVVFLSDGVANVGETDPAKIAERVKPMRQKGIYLNTIGVGMNNHNDVLLEQLADKADGMCAYIDTADEAKKQLVDNFSGAFQPIARDVKIQVEFDATQVLRYRLLGYENRAIADADFRNDKVDAGELGAGHQVTALYEIERQGTANLEKPLATVRVRWKEPSRFGMNPEADTASEVTQPVSAGPASTFEGAGQSYRKAVMAAQFAEILRRSVHARGDSLDGLLNDALKLQQEIPNDKDFTEFVMLVSKSKDLIVRTMPACDELCQAIDEVRENQYRRAQIESLQRELDQNTLAELRRQNDVLEARLRDLVRRRLENQVR